MSTLVTDAAAAVDRFAAAFATQDLDAITAAITDDCVFESTTPPEGVRHAGKAAARAAWAELFASSPGAQFTLEERIVAGDRVIDTWRYDWAGADPGHVRGVDIFRVRDGLVAEKASYVKG
jgi:hypothetical protein